MTASRCRTSSATSRSTTRPTAKTTATATTPISAGIAASKGRPTIPRSSRCATGRSAISWRRCCCRWACRCCWPATSSATRQRGNNNAYCQDNEISWLDWQNIRPEDAALRDFVRYLIRLRRQHRVFSRPRFFRGEVLSEAGLKDITWVTPAGVEATGEDWGNPVALSLGYVLCGAAGEFYTPGGQRDIDESFLVMMNAYHGDLDFHFPRSADAARLGGAGRYRRADRARAGRPAMAAGRGLSVARRIPSRCSSTARRQRPRRRVERGRGAGDAAA